jgi:hypothetical protein
MVGGDQGATVICTAIRSGVWLYLILARIPPKSHEYYQDTWDIRERRGNW